MTPPSLGATRDRILALVREEPGSGTRALAARIGLQESTVAYHLRRLERDGDVQTHLAGRERVWFATLCGLCPVLREAMPLVARPPVAKVAQALGPTPRNASELAADTGLARGTARWAATRLARSFLVERSRGRTAIRDGAEVCLQKALQGETCGLWGRCAVSLAWRDRRAGPLGPKAKGK